jgi:hypothetical protein
MTYTEADSLLQGRNLHSRKIGNNTYLHRVSGVPGDDIAIRLHDTDILRFKADGSVVLHTGGWRTVTTKERMNEHLRDLGFRIDQRSFKWYVSERNPLGEYYDGMTLNSPKSTPEVS